jgi:hypothetical protein
LIVFANAYKRAEEEEEARAKKRIFIHNIKIKRKKERQKLSFFRTKERITTHTKFLVYSSKITTKKKTILRKFYFKIILHLSIYSLLLIIKNLIGKRTQQQAKIILKKN